MLQDFISHSPGETQVYASKILKRLKNLKINLICLYGDLGSGKTTFVQGLAKALGIRKRILSPTFVLIRQYQIPIDNQQLTINNFYHVDCYRLESTADLKSVNLEEFWSEPNNLVAIEWAERIKSILSKKRIDIKFSYIDENKRKITVNC